MIGREFEIGRKLRQGAMGAEPLEPIHPGVALQAGHP